MVRLVRPSVWNTDMNLEGNYNETHRRFLGCEYSEECSRSLASVTSPTLMSFEERNSARALNAINSKKINYFGQSCVERNTTYYS